LDGVFVHREFKKMDQGRILVTGSSRGIGKAIALRLAQDGWNIAVHYSGHKDDAEKVMRQLGKRASGLYSADLVDTNEAKSLFAAVIKDGPINGLVNNAGVYLPLNFSGSGDAAFEANWHKTFAINFDSPIVLIRAAVKHFQHNGGGKILNVCSRVGFKGEGGAALYAASKAALINITRSLAVELAPRNIRLFGIAPGWVDTSMAREGMIQKESEILAGIPLGRMGAPSDCAAAAAFLLSAEADYLSGTVLDINGASYFH
jgi:3-oxoacyl-[acyl-carrier protein] reductase